MNMNMSTNTNRSTNKFDDTFNVPEAIIPGGHILHITVYSNNFNFIQSNNTTSTSSINGNNGSDYSGNGGGGGGGGSIHSHSHVGGSTSMGSSSRNNVQHQQFVMRLDGQRYSQFCKIYELGSPSMKSKYGLVLEKARLLIESNIHGSNYSNNNNSSNSNNNNGNGGGGNGYRNAGASPSANNSHCGNSAPPKIHNNDEGEEEADALVRGRPMYRPKSSEAKFRSMHYMNMSSNNNNSTPYSYRTDGDGVNVNANVNRGRSNTADNGIQFQQRRQQQQQQQFSYDRSVPASKSEDMHNHQNYFGQDDGEDDRYWERTPVLPTQFHGRTTRTANRQQQQKSKSLSPRRKSKKAVHNNPINMNNNTQQHSNQYSVQTPYHHHHNQQQQQYGIHKFDERDVANNSIQEQKYIAEARINSFRDLRGEQQPYERNNNARNNNQQRWHNNQYQHQQQQEEDDMSIPTFARPPRVITSKKKGHSPPTTKTSESIHRDSNSNNNNSTNQHYHHQQRRRQQQQNHLKAVQETNSLSDLLDNNYNDNKNNNTPDRNSFDGEISTLIRSTSSITLDTMLRDMDASTIATEQYPHLDPNPTQMMKTQQNLNFKLQLNPPVYADSSAGDLIQPTPSFSGIIGSGSFGDSHKNIFTGTTGVNTSGVPAPAPGHAPRGQQQQYHPQKNSTNHSATPSQPMSYTPMNFAQPQQQQQYHQHNPMNYAGRHMEMGAGPTMNQQQQTQSAGFVAAPPPTWDTLNDAFGATPLHHNTKEVAHQ